jgi:hypothetical protein
MPKRPYAAVSIATAVVGLAALSPLAATAAPTSAATGSAPAGVIPAVAVATTPAPPAVRCPAPVSFAAADVAGSYLGGSIHRQTVTMRAQCPGVKGVATLTAKVNANATRQLTGWKTWWKESAGITPTTGSYERTNRLVVDVPGLAVVRGDAYLYAGGAHGVETRTYDILVTRTGRIVTKDGMLAQMQAAGGPRWNFERELNRWAGGADPDQHAWITRDEVAMYPEKSGMHISVGHCTAYACAAGIVDYTIPWASLIGNGVDMSFIPNQWGY